MNRDSSDEAATGAIDAALARLPAWEPPADFAARLAAAATRQAMVPAPRTAPQWRWLPGLTTGVLAGLGGMALALLLAEVPWGALLTHPAFAWLATAGFGAAGLFFSQRLRRTA